MDITDVKNIKIYYDDGCPFCSRYVQYVNFKKAHGVPELIDVRKNDRAYEMLRDKGYEIDDGMVVEINGNYYAGGDAINVMSLLSTPSTLFNKLNGALFFSKSFSRLSYPVLKFFRNAVISVLNRKKIKDIHNPENNNIDTDQFSIFAFTWAFFSIFNACYMASYYYDYPERVNFITLLIPFFAGILVFVPRSKEIFSILLALQGINIFYELPASSNHFMIHTFFVWGSSIIGLYYLFKRRSFAAFFETIAPLGRSLLIIMYFFGIFHKINTDFLNPDVSCAVALWRVFPLPFGLQESLILQYAAIYGTFIVEGFIMFTLLTQKFRYTGLIAGILFHGAIGYNEYANYCAFSSIVIALHTLFLPKSALQNFRTSAVYISMSKDTSGYGNIFAWSFLIFCTLLGFSTYYLHLEETSKLSYIYWTMYFVPFSLFLLLAANARQKQKNFSNFFFFPKNIFLALLVLLFLFNGFTPYLGLKTRQSINMFANLHLEGGRSNHLIFSNPPWPFDYLETTVKIIDATDFNLDAAGHTLVYYEFLSLIENTGIKKGTVSYEINGEVKNNITYNELKPEMERLLHPAWFRKFFHFMVVDFTNPKPCSAKG